MTNLESKVQDLLNADPAAMKFRLRVVEELTRQEDDWTYIVVQPGLPGIRAYDYSELLTKIEAAVRKAEGANVLVVPASGDLN